jgi:hypothetical protein
MSLGRAQSLIEAQKGPINPWYTKIGTIDADISLSPEDSGTFWGVDTTSAITVTLPDLNPSLLGLTYEFGLFASNTNGTTIRCSEGGGGEVMRGIFILGDDQVSSTSDGANGRIVAAGGSDAKIVLDSNATNGGGEAGSYIRAVAVTSAVWYIYGIILAPTTSNGADLFQAI